MTYAFLTTADGSPTLAHAHGEAMHNGRGALAETLHVYGPLADALAAGRVAPFAVVVGLGLGYVEALLAARAPDLARLVTFEADARLAEAFLASLAPVDDASAPHDALPPPPLVDLVRDVRARVAEAHGLAAEALRARLFRWWSEGRLGVAGALDGEALESVPQGHALASAPPPLLGYGGLFFDAYSAKVDAGLWAPAFLEALLAHAAPRAGVATYAARGSLTRALAARGFTRESRAGFGGKRECTLAFR